VSAGLGSSDQGSNNFGLVGSDKGVNVTVSERQL